MPAVIEVSALIAMFAQAGPIGFGGVALMEKLCPVVPSHVVFVLLGMTAASGEGDLVTAVIASAAGSTIGALWWYGLGLALGPERSEKLFARLGMFVKPDLYRRMAAAYRRNHFWATVAGQVIPMVRVFLSVPAGVLNLAVAKFLVATLIGSLLWIAPLVSAGYWAYGSGADVASAGWRLVAALVSFEIFVLLVWQLARRRGDA